MDGRGFPLDVTEVSKSLYRLSLDHAHLRLRRNYLRESKPRWLEERSVLRSGPLAPTAYHHHVEVGHNWALGRCRMLHAIRHNPFEK